ncbi:MAG TPA: hypothetical protein VGL46_21435 [Pseudonocardiaceae bacterium]
MLAETGVEVPRDVSGQIVRAIRPISSPHTLHAWTATYTMRIMLPGEPPAVDPATTAFWAAPGLALSTGILDGMWPDHRRALIAALTL